METRTDDLWASVTIMHSIVFGSVARGADLEALCRAGGIEPAFLQSGDARLSLEQNIRIMESALAQTADPLLGLHLADFTTTATLGLLGHLVESSPDILTALTNLCQFLRAVSTIYDYRTEVRGDAVLFYAEPIAAWCDLSPETARVSVELTLGSFVRTMKQMTGWDFTPTAVSFRHPRPGDVREYLRVFKIMPEFGQPANFIAMRSRDAQLPLIGHNKALNTYFREALEKQIERTFEQDTFANTVRRLMLQQFGQAVPQLEDLAALLHLTPRTVQRRLQEEGAGFQQIADSVKSELAQGLLKKRALSVSEVAYRLGYSDASVFRRAFKKWTGYSPGTYAEQGAEA